MESNLKNIANLVLLQVVVVQEKQLLVHSNFGCCERETGWATLNLVILVFQLNIFIFVLLAQGTLSLSL